MWPSGLLDRAAPLFSLDTYQSAMVERSSGDLPAGAHVVTAEVMVPTGLLGPSCAMEEWHLTAEG
jgi:hypothetical protein